MSRTLSGLFLVGALNRPRKRKRANRENPRTIPEQIGKIPEKSGKSQKGQKRTKKEGQVQIGKPPRLKHPRLAALDIQLVLQVVIFGKIRAEPVLLGSCGGVFGCKFLPHRGQNRNLFLPRQPPRARNLVQNSGFEYGFFAGRDQLPHVVKGVAS